MGRVLPYAGIQDGRPWRETGEGTEDICIEPAVFKLRKEGTEGKRSFSEKMEMLCMRSDT